MRKESNKLIIQLAPPQSLLALLPKLKPLQEQQFPRIADQPPEPIEF